MGTTFFGVGSSGSVGPTNGGKVSGVNAIGTSPIVVLNTNPARQTLTFHNPGTGTLYVGPVLTGTGQPNAIGLGVLAGAFMIVSGGLLIITGECQGAWQAFAASGTINPLTIMESNI